MKTSIRQNYFKVYETEKCDSNRLPLNKGTNTTHGLEEPVKGKGYHQEANPCSPFEF